MYIETEVRPSKIHGLGIFAKELIPKDTIIWKFTPGFDLKFSKEQITTFPKLLQEYLQTYCWLSKKSDKYCFASDNAKYFNHSNSPNSRSTYYQDEEEVITTAIKDIEIGEEITDDYGSFEKENSNF
jgi:SET domain-containing protein